MERFGTEKVERKSGTSPYLNMYELETFTLNFLLARFYSQRFIV